MQEEERRAAALMASRASELRLKAELNAEKVAHNEATSAMLDARADRANSKSSWRKLRPPAKSCERSRGSYSGTKLSGQS